MGACRDEIAESLNLRGHVFDADFQQELHRRGETKRTDRIQSSALITARVGPQRHVAGGVIGVAFHCRPAELDGFDPVLPVLLNVKDAVAFRAQQPLVPIGGERLDVHLPHVQRERAQTLNRVHEEEDPVPAADLADGFEIGPVAAQVLDKADGEQFRPARGRLDLFKRVEIG